MARVADALGLNLEGCDCAACGEDMVPPRWLTGLKLCGAVIGGALWLGLLLYAFVAVLFS